MRFTAIAPVLLLALSGAANAQTQARSAEQVDYAGFIELTEDVATLRAERLLSKEEFFTQAHADGALLLDTRSASAFAEGHIDGAFNLPFSDFTQEKLREVIGEDTDRAIYIYCNNNFSDDEPPVALKSAPLALNIPTFINLVGYGYANVWELGDTLPTAEANWVSQSAN